MTTTTRTQKIIARAASLVRAIERQGPLHAGTRELADNFDQVTSHHTSAGWRWPVAGGGTTADREESARSWAALAE